ncbi:MAG: hydroxyacid dehydrogenase [Acidimicrobiales bacterium]|jgi:phosphoglycerate dehydrogenase-like enzyme|nr:hydroxyacid dehydrogenase [Acidimicrobiales bacterium]MDP6280680.1 hydroxyacid dehydrogenase [Acidimicrobiales bacterium]MDP7118131.1 hydroxyacid dehydrogenase [Acidimicrobiales bacterium]MEE1522334.1 hydroxyacid dehydrogenase [Acidimicrobiales bacterium]MEE1571246.1 hydroxyacid dehydrogenase [Acidimicrobiales bacterium]|tara:strand:- start:684 stop:1691 length:1008 start_codon:yes stop_codon:yes gene_type:complete
MNRPVVAVTIGRSHYERMFSEGAWESLDGFAEVVHHDGPEPADRGQLKVVLAGADACITSWGVAQLDAGVLAAAPGLRAMAHMGSSVKRFISDGFWPRGIRLTSAGVMLARDVAETTLGLMIVGRKSIWPLAQHVSEGGWRDSPNWDDWKPGEMTGATIGLVGASNVGRHVIELLAPFDCEVLVSDPFLDTDKAQSLGVSLVDLDELMERSNVVSLHCPENEHTRHMIGSHNLPSMRDGALLINTARGGLIDEDALAVELETGRLFAFLDVTDPEPPAPNSPLRSLDNVAVTPHIAGCIQNCTRMGETAVEDLRRFFAGEPAIYEITEDMLDRIA